MCRREELAVAARLSLADGKRFGHVLPLLVSLVLGAFLMSAVASGQHAGYSLFTVFPLFVCIRTERPPLAMLCGAFWGVCVYLSSISLPGTPVAHGLGSFALLIAAPAAFGWLGAALTQRAGFSPLVLAVGWTGVELALTPLGLKYGLLGALAGGGVLHVMAGAIGYVFVAFLVAYAGACVVTVLACVPVRAPRVRRVIGVGAGSQALIPQTVSYAPLLSICRTRPRAPPA